MDIVSKHQENVHHVQPVMDMQVVNVPNVQLELMQQ